MVGDAADAVAALARDHQAKATLDRACAAERAAQTRRDAAEKQVADAAAMTALAQEAEAEWKRVAAMQARAATLAHEARSPHRQLALDALSGTSGAAREAYVRGAAVSPRVGSYLNVRADRI